MNGTSINKFAQFLISTKNIVDLNHILKRFRYFIIADKISVIITFSKRRDVVEIP